MERILLGCFEVHRVSTMPSVFYHHQILDHFLDIPSILAKGGD